MENPNLLYHFLPAKYAVQTIETGLLKITRLADLNDPFDLTTAITGEPDNIPPERIAKFERLAIDRLNPLAAMICFCKSFRDPAMWTHYAEKHTGVVLGFENLTTKDSNKIIPDFVEVSYTDFNGQPSKCRPDIDLPTFKKLPRDEKFRKMLTVFSRKSFSWSYEEEVRIFCCLKDCIPDGGLWFCKLKTSHFKIVQVIAGIRCPISDDYFRRSLMVNGLTEVEAKRAKSSRTKYEVEI